MSQVPQLNKNTGVLCMLLALFAMPGIIHAASVDSISKYAWSSVGGWVNFNPTNGDVQVNNTGLTGYAWSANDGWINLSPTNGGVVNNGQGVLSGFAWDEVAGWIDFSGVTIDSSGTFHGEATGASVNGVQNIINFSCANCDVVTSWRPISSTPQTSAAVTIFSGLSGQIVNKILAVVAPSLVQPPPQANPPSNEPPPGAFPNTLTSSSEEASGTSHTASQAGKSPISPLITGAKANTSLASNPTASSTKASHSFLSNSSSAVRITAFTVGVVLAALIIVALIFSR